MSFQKLFHLFKIRFLEVKKVTFLMPRARLGCAAFFLGGSFWRLESQRYDSLLMLMNTAGRFQLQNWRTNLHHWPCRFQLLIWNLSFGHPGSLRRRSFPLYGSESIESVEKEWFQFGCFPKWYAERKVGPTYSNVTFVWCQQFFLFDQSMPRTDYGGTGRQCKVLMITTRVDTSHHLGQLTPFAIVPDCTLWSMCECLQIYDLASN